MVHIVPSILACDLTRLQEEVASIDGHADWLQVDVMDGHFVPNLTFGAPLIKNLRTKLPLDIHLMVTNPADRIQEFIDVHAAHITFHAEAVTGTMERKALIAAIRKGGATAGIAINPETPVSAIDDVVTDIDLVLVMSVHPGFAGQRFIPDALAKIKELQENHPSLMIEVDGGIDVAAARLAREAGATHIVAASAIFNANDRVAAIAALRG
jgi:ribulose-phosphate 3-epimerase